MITDQSVKEKIGESLRRAYFNDPLDTVDVSDGDFAGDVYLVVISPKFNGQDYGEKSDLLWSKIFEVLPPEEWGQITLSIGLSPAEANGRTIDDIKAGM